MISMFNLLAIQIIHTLEMIMKTLVKLLLLLSVADLNAVEAVVPKITAEVEDMVVELLTMKDKAISHRMNKIINGKIDKITMNMAVPAEAEVKDSVQLTIQITITTNPPTNATIITTVIDIHMAEKKKVQDMIRMKTNMVKMSTAVQLEEEIGVVNAVE